MKLTELRKGEEARIIKIDKTGELNKKIKDTQKSLEQKVWDKYPALKEDEIKSLVVF